MNLLQSYTTGSAEHTREMSNLVLGVPLVALLIATLVMWGAAIVSVARSTYTVGMKAVFICGVLVFPIIGSLAWFFIVKKHQPAPVFPSGSASR